MIMALSERVEKAAQFFYSSQVEICTERAEIITDVYKKNEHLPNQIKRAVALDDILSKMSIYIKDHELIVANQSSKPRSAPVFPEFTVEYIEDELEQFEKRPGDVFKVSSETKKKLKEIISYWKGKTVRDRNLAMLPEETMTAGEDETMRSAKLGEKGIGAIDSNWVLENGDGHLSVNYFKLINLGLRHNIDFCKKKLDELEVWQDPEYIKKRLFWQSVIIVNEAVIKFANRFADLAETMSKKENKKSRSNELDKIAEICRHVPENPPRSFHEGLQFVWFIQLTLQLETNGHSISIGRLDQYLHPLYEKDINNGDLTREGALELFELFKVKINEITKLRSWGCTEFMRGFPTFQNMTIGGQTSDRKDAANELSFIILDATEDLRMVQPSLTASISTVTSDKFLERCAEVVSTGGGLPAFFNNEAVIPSMVYRGVKEEDALDYCMVGCVEPSVPGKWGGRYGACFFNMVKVFELALYNGTDPRTGFTLCEGIGDLSTFKSFEELFEAFTIQVEYYTRQQVIKDNVQDYAWEELIPTPLISSMVDDCLERGKELKQGGAIYDFSGGQTGGIANVANSMAAIKKLVFEEKVLTGKEIFDAMRSNFEGPGGREIQQMLINKAPKYGNDIDYVDSIAKEAFSVFLKGVDKYKNTRWGRGPIGCTWHPSTASVSANVPMGGVIGATPDGRKAGQPLADVESASHGTDKNGPTAIVRSASKIEHKYMSGGSLLNIRISESSFKQ